MKVNSLAKVVAGLAATMFVGPLWAGSVTIISPDKTQTHAESRVKEARFIWSDKDQTLYAVIRFSNELYIMRGNPLDEESFVFKLPKVRFDPAAKSFYTLDSNGQRVPVATTENGLFGRRIKPALGTYVHIQTKHGEVRLAMTAGTTSASQARRNHWLDEGNGFLFRNVVSQ